MGMKTLRIRKIEVDGDCFAVTFAMNRGDYFCDFDLNQLGSDVQILSTCDDMVMAVGVDLKVGDSITDQQGGQPVLGAVRGEAQPKNMSIVKESDYRDAFRQKTTGEGEK